MGIETAILVATLATAGATAAGAFKKAPKVSGEAGKELKAGARKAKKSRTALFATQGGARGEEIDPEQISSRTTLLGN